MTIANCYEMKPLSQIVKIRLASIPRDLTVIMIDRLKKLGPKCDEKSGLILKGIT